MTVLYRVLAASVDADGDDLPPAAAASESSWLGDDGFSDASGSVTADDDAAALAGADTGTIAAASVATGHVRTAVAVAQLLLVLPAVAAGAGGEKTGAGGRSGEAAPSPKDPLAMPPSPRNAPAPLRRSFWTDRRSGEDKRSTGKPGAGGCTAAAAAVRTDGVGGARVCDVMAASLRGTVPPPPLLTAALGAATGDDLKEAQSLRRGGDRGPVDAIALSRGFRLTVSPFCGRSGSPGAASRRREERVGRNGMKRRSILIGRRCPHARVHGTHRTPSEIDAQQL